jgi:hypothetical protein
MRRKCKQEENTHMCNNGHVADSRSAANRVRGRSVVISIVCRCCSREFLGHQEIRISVVNGLLKWRLLSKYARRDTSNHSGFALARGARRRRGPRAAAKGPGKKS